VTSGAGIQPAPLPCPMGMSQTVHLRSFVDADGLEWTVREIDSPSLTGALARVLEHDRRRGGWLVFESAEGAKRRLAPYPEDWRTISEFELERWRMRAIPAPPAPTRRVQD
jgi:hypothetical protein